MSLRAGRRRAACRRGAPSHTAQLRAPQQNARCPAMHWCAAPLKWGGPCLHATTCAPQPSPRGQHARLEGRACRAQHTQSPPHAACPTPHSSVNGMQPTTICGAHKRAVPRPKMRTQANKTQATQQNSHTLCCQRALYHKRGAPTMRAKQGPSTVSQIRRADLSSTSCAGTAAHCAPPPHP